ncbi:Atu4866 domain-containing protein [Nonomuraea sp. PA05]|nr:Atu4866 domain-containing protein [Nonomuraea sp. PA05]
MTACADGGRASKRTPERASASPHPYVGMWVTADGRVRQELR